MSNITLRLTKGSPLTNQEVDDNFANLNTDKYQSGDSVEVSDIVLQGGAAGEGVLSWDTDKHTAKLTMGNGVVQQIGEEVYYPKNTRNMTGATIPNGTPVMLVGGVGDDSYISPAIADGSIPSDNYVGVVTEDVANGDYGRVAFFGSINDVDTSAFSKGDILYVSATTAGGYTTTKPSSPNYQIQAALVTSVNATTGRLFIRVHVNPDASEVGYDNNTSGLVSSNVQGALDELQSNKASVDLLSSNITLFPTTATSPDVTGHNRLVTTKSDSDYDDTAVDVNTGLIGTSETLVGQLASDAGLVEGSIAGITVTLLGNIEKLTGNANQGSHFYFKIYRRESGGTEHLMGESLHTEVIYETNGYEQFSSSVYLSNSGLSTFSDTDRFVLRFYGISASTATSYRFQFGGDAPIRSIVPVPVSVIPASSAAETPTDTANFGGILSSSNTNVQSALDTLDDHGHNITDVTGLETALNGKVSTTGYNKTNWDTAFGWGDHSTEGYLTAVPAEYLTQTEGDARYVQGSGGYNKSDWDTAFGWGDHSIEGYLTSFTETDPVFSASPAGSITTTKKNQWDAAYGWGNHADEGYLTSFTETDPTVPSHVKGITTGQIGNWTTAYNWGNHASAGYLLLTGGSLSGNLTVGANTSGSNLVINDIDGARYQMRTGGYDLKFEKHDADGGVYATALELRGVNANDGSPSVYVNNKLEVNGNLEFDGVATTTSQNFGVVWTGFDKEGTTDPSDNAYIKHLTNTAGLTGSVLEISSMNDANDGINLKVNSTTAGARINGQPIFNDGYHPNADKWTTARSHTVTLTGDVTGSATQSVDGTGNRTWTVSTAVGNNSHSHNTSSITDLSANTVGNDANSITVSGFYHVDDNRPTSGGDPDVAIIHNQYGSSGSWATQIATSWRHGRAWLRNKENGNWESWHEIFSDNYHPNADKWTTPRTNTVTLTGDATGSGNASVDGSGNWTVSVPVTVANDSHNHDHADGDFSVYGDLKMAGTDSYIWTPSPSTGFTGLWDQPNGRQVWRYQNDVGDLELKRPTKVLVGWGAGNNNYPEAFTIQGTFPSYTLRSTNTNAVWLHHMEGDGDLTWYYGVNYVDDAWQKKLELNKDGNLYHEGTSKFWHAGNDGSGSGLDADLLDGVQGSSFLRSDADDTFTGNLSTGANNYITFGPNSTWASYLRIGGNGRTVSGANSASVVTTNGNLHIDAGASSDRGVYLNYYAGGHGTIFGNGAGGIVARIDSAGNLYKANSATNIVSTYWHSGNDGSGSGLDADLLDGKDHTNFGATLATYGTTGASAGRIRCTAPFNTNSEHMFQVTISVYTSYTTHTYLVSGYMYPTTNQWYSPTVIYTGTGTPDILVGRATDGKAYISIGNGSYTGVRVHNMTRGYQTNVSDTYDPWTISITNSVENSVTPAVSEVWHSTNDGSNSGLDADLLDGNHASAFALAHSHPYLSSASDSEQVGEFGLIYWNKGTAKVNSDPRTNEPNYDADLTNIHWWSTTAAGANYGRVGHALYNGSAYQYLHTRSGQAHLYHNNNKMWTSGNDGSGSGLDADLLDGVHASSFNRKDTNTQYLRPYYAYTNYLTTQSANTLSNQMGGDGGIRVDFINGQSFGTWGHCLTWSGYHAYNMYQLAGYYHVNGASDLWFRSEKDHTNDEWTAWNKIYHTGNDGSGSGLDADMVDGVQAASIVYGTSGKGTTSGNFASTADAKSGFHDVYNSGTPTATWYSMINMAHYGGNHGHQIAGSFYSAGDIYNRHNSNTNFSAWTKMWNSANDGSGSGLDADLLDGLDGAAFARRAADNLYTGVNHFRSNTNTSGSNPPLQAYATGGSGAIMSFHRSGYYAVNMGLDSDNVFRIGGWSASTNRLQMDMSGNLTMAGNITAYSDIRLKENIKVIDSALEKVTLIRGVTFTRNDTDDPDKSHTGVIAQEVEAVLPEAVSEDNSGIKNVAYGNMVGLLIEAIKELKSEVDNLKQQLKDK